MPCILQLKALHHYNHRVTVIVFTISHHHLLNLDNTRLKEYGSTKVSRDLKWSTATACVAVNKIYAYLCEIAGIYFTHYDTPNFVTILQFTIALFFI